MSKANSAVWERVEMTSVRHIIWAEQTVSHQDSAANGTGQKRGLEEI